MIVLDTSQWADGMRLAGVEQCAFENLLSKTTSLSAIERTQWLNAYLQCPHLNMSKLILLLDKFRTSNTLTLSDWEAYFQSITFWDNLHFEPFIVLMKRLLAKGVLRLLSPCVQSKLKVVLRNSRFELDLNAKLLHPHSNVLDYTTFVDQNKRYFGIELEYQLAPIFWAEQADLLEMTQFYKQDWANSFKEWCSFNEEKVAIVKEDKTLDEPSYGRALQGVEIVSKPMELVQLFSYLDQLAINPSFSKFCQPTSHCGVHIHVSKKGLSKLAQAKLMKFVYDAKNAQYLVKYAGRCSAEYASFSVTPNLKMITDSQFRFRPQDRYVAVNFKNKNTIEFRIFKATKNCAELKLHIALIDTLLDFIVTTSLQELKFEKYLAYLKKNHPCVHKAISEKF